MYKDLRTSRTGRCPSARDFFRDGRAHARIAKPASRHRNATASELSVGAESHRNAAASQNPVGTRSFATASGRAWEAHVYVLSG